METERLEVTRRVMRAMRHESGRRPLVERDADGARRVVICLPSDTVRYACERVREAGGRATVVVPARGGLLPLRWHIDEAAPGMFACDGPIHPESTMGMLIEWWMAGAHHEVTFSLSAGSVEVAGDGNAITVPA